MDKKTKQPLSALFSKEELVELEKSLVLLFLSKTAGKINQVLGNDVEIFNRFLNKGEGQEALRLLNDKNVNLKEIISESEKELSENLGDKLSTVLKGAKS